MVELLVMVIVGLIVAICIWHIIRGANNADRHYYIKTKARLLYTKPRKNDKEHVDTFWSYILDGKELTDVLGDETTKDYFNKEQYGNEFDVFVTILADDDGKDANFVCWYPHFEETYLQYDSKTGNYTLCKSLRKQKTATQNML